MNPRALSRMFVAAAAAAAAPHLGMPTRPRFSTCSHKAPSTLRASSGPSLLSASSCPSLFQGCLKTTPSALRAPAASHALRPTAPRRPMSEFGDSNADFRFRLFDEAQAYLSIAVTQDLGILDGTMGPAHVLQMPPVYLLITQ